MPGKRRKFKTTIHDPEWVRSRHAEGWTASAIAQAAGCSVNTATRCLSEHVGPDWNKSNTDPEKLRAMRGRFEARAIYGGVKQPCIICGDPDGEINHIDMDPCNNDQSNHEWLCKPHHLMVDKRRSAMAVKLFVERFPGEWKEIHDKVLKIVAVEIPKHLVRPRANRLAPVSGARLTRENAAEMRELANGGMSESRLALRFGVSTSAVSAVLSGAIFRGDARMEVEPYQGPTDVELAPRVKYPHGAAPGSRNNNAKLDAAKVQAIRFYFARDVARQLLADAFGCTHTNISFVVKVKTWTRVVTPATMEGLDERYRDMVFTPKPRPNPYLGSAAEERARAIKRDLAAGMSQADVTREHGVSAGLVSMIASGKRWADLEA